MQGDHRTAAIVLLSDPNTGGEEALGRVFNALAAAYDFKSHSDDVRLLFQGAATRWPAELSEPDHPAHELFREVSDTIAGASCGCADVFGARDALERSGLELLVDNPAPGTSGLPSLRELSDQGFDVITF